MDTAQVLHDLALALALALGRTQRPKRLLLLLLLSALLPLPFNTTAIAANLMRRLSQKSSITVPQTAIPPVSDVVESPILEEMPPLLPPLPDSLATVLRRTSRDLVLDRDPQQALPTERRATSFETLLWQLAQPV